MTDYQTYVPPELMPPIEGMDAHWYVLLPHLAHFQLNDLNASRMNVMSGLDDWWKNYTYLGSLSGYMAQ